MVELRLFFVLRYEIFFILKDDLETVQSFYRYIGITSLCLYIITIIFEIQDAILYKVTKMQLCKIQIYTTQRQIPIDNTIGIWYAYRVGVPFGTLFLYAFSLSFRALVRPSGLISPTASRLLLVREGPTSS